MNYLDRQPAKDAAFGLLSIQTLLLVFSLLLGGASSILNFMIIVPISLFFAIYLSVAEGSEILYYKKVPIRILWIITLALADMTMVLISIYKLYDQPLWFFYSKFVFYGLLLLIQIVKLPTFSKLLGKPKVMWITYVLSNLMSGGIFYFAYLGTIILSGYMEVSNELLYSVWGILLIVQMVKVGFPLINMRLFDASYRFHRVYDIFDSFIILILSIWSLLALFLFS
ncbi:MAG: hypothetical protein U1C51_05440 [Candidatus Izemoplasmatales bacterium]|jgi:hypothetical protein|nr:hypothetical protein [bacterium]MDZ4196679.1 hypothetical protein [Candidatus Izemoplasmatales bacterium]